jgi:alpha-tubulin suppressor-like RCC1 family protein
VTGLSSGVDAITGAGTGQGDFLCALLIGGSVKCVGANDSGQLGDGTTGTASSVPVSVSGFSGGVTAISAGGSHACALLTSGAVKCWGSNNYGALGDGSDIDSSVPVTVTGLQGH